MPCSYSCPETIKSVGRLRREIGKNEPGYVELADHYLKMPFLVLYERKFYCFDGQLKDGKIKYTNVCFPIHDHSLASDSYEEDLKNGDTIKLEGRRILIFKKNKLQKTIEAPYTTFAPEYPFLINFNE